MKREFLLLLCLCLPLAGQIKRQERSSLLDSDPDVVYLEQVFSKPFELQVVQEAPVYSDKDGKRRLGTLKANQTVRLEAMTEKAYRVRGEGTRHGIAGWVTPAAFSAKDPDFVENLKKFYERQIQVQELIEAKQVAIGMTTEEVTQAKGKPTKTTSRRTEEGQSGRWEFIDYEEVKHYTTRVDPRTGFLYRQLSHITQEEKNKVVVEFENNLVTAIEESKSKKGGNVRIVVPPLVFGW